MSEQPSPPPQAPKQSAASGCAGLFFFALLFFWWLSEQEKSERRNRELRAEQAAQEAQNRRRAPIRGIAAWATRSGGFHICSHSTLHNCVVKFGQDVGIGPSTVQWPQTQILATENCNTQLASIAQACSDGGVNMLATGEQRDAYARCAAPLGLLVRSSLVRILDPRDEQVPPGTLEIQCDDGRSVFQFN